LNDVLKILESASKLSLQKVKEEDDSDLFAYLIQLRETLVESYTTIVHGVNQEQTKKQLVSYAPTIFMFLQQLVNRDMNPSKVLITLYPITVLIGLNKEHTRIDR
jgi:hypothetical protein